jgi:hypothetical protein
MKVLLDENLPHAMRHLLPGHDVFTVSFMGWSGTRNGALLKLAASAGFAVMITQDDGVAYQQNLKTLPLALIILSAPSNDIDDIKPLIPDILVCIDHLVPCSLHRVP